MQTHLALGRQRQENYEFQASLVYKAVLRHPGWHKEILSHKREQNNANR